MRSRTGSGGGIHPATRTTPEAAEGPGDLTAAGTVPAAKRLPQAAVSEATSTFTPGPIVEESDTFFT